MIRKATNDLTIKPKMSSMGQAILLLGGLSLISLLLYLAYQQGVRSGHTQYQSDRELIAQLNESLNELQAKLNSAEENLIFAQRHKQIQEEAYKQISSAYASAEQKNRYLGSRLDFYRSIISPEDGKSGPVIQSLAIDQVDSNINFSVTLVQAIKHKHQVRGNLRVSLYEGEAILVEWPDSGSRSINFQYFQQISGIFEDIQLSKSARIRVEFEVIGGESIEKWFDVATLLN